jgi:hypothetical protein
VNHTYDFDKFVADSIRCDEWKGDN